jgi:DNA-binding LacI/PurR family transcriptional regulator
MMTMKDEAQRAMVSTTTVSHVLNGTRVVQPQTRWSEPL